MAGVLRRALGRVSDTDSCRHWFICALVSSCFVAKDGKQDRKPYPKEEHLWDSQVLVLRQMCT